MRKVESQVLNAGKERSWSLDMLLLSDDVGGQVTVISALGCADFVFKGSSKGIVNVDAIFISVVNNICLRAGECSDVGVGGGCIGLESRYGLALSSDLMRILFYLSCGDALLQFMYDSW